MRPGPILAAIAAALASAAAAAQSCDLRVEPKGTSAVVSLASDGVSAEDLLVRLAAGLGALLKTDGEALKTLQAETPRVRVTGMAAKDLVEHLAGAAGAEGRYEDGVITVVSWPDASDTGRLDTLRGAAIRAGERAAMEPADPPADPAAWRVACLRRAGGDHERALAGFRAFYEDHPEDPHAARARLLAALCADDLGRPEECRAILEELERHHPAAAELRVGQLHLARCLIRLGQPAEALLRLERVVHGSGDPRLEAVASLMLAELHWLRGEADAALETLARLGSDLDRTFPDLGGRIPLFTGLCLLRKNGFGEAIPHLQLVVLSSEVPADRARAARELVQAYLAVGDPTTALVAAETARRLQPQGPALWATLLSTAAHHERIGLPVLARRAYEEVVRNAPEEEPVRREAEAGLARVLLRERRFAEAREWFQRLARDRDDPAGAVLGAARCEIGLGDWRRALDVLALLPAGLPEETAREAAGLRGRCWMELGEFARATLAFQGVKEGP